MNASDNVVVMDQHSDGCDASTAGAVRAGQYHVNSHSAQVQLTEKPVAGLLMLRASTEQQIKALSTALQACCGIGLAQRLSSAGEADYCVRWMGPDAWLLSCPLNEAFGIEQKLRSNTNEHIAVVQVSGGYTVLELSGEKALQVLQKSTAYDTHPENFPTGKVVNTTFAKAQLTLRAINTGRDARYEIIVRRSFSHYLELWLQRATLEYGLEGVV